MKKINTDDLLKAGGIVLAGTVIWKLITNKMNGMGGGSGSCSG